jgi:hypothetical protein
VSLYRLQIPYDPRGTKYYYSSDSKHKDGFQKRPFNEAACVSSIEISIEMCFAMT